MFPSVPALPKTPTRPTPCSSSSSSSVQAIRIIRRRRRRMRRFVAIMVAIICLALSAAIVSSSSSFRSPSRRCRSNDSKKCLAHSSLITSSRILSPPSSTSSILSRQSNAFVFSLLRRRRKNRARDNQTDQQDSSTLVKINGDYKHSLIKNGTPQVQVNGNGKNGHHIHYNLGQKSNGHNGHNQQTNQLFDIDIVEDEPYATTKTTIHPIQNAYNKLSSFSVKKEPTLKDIAESGSLDAMEGISDDYVDYILASESDDSSERYEDDSATTSTISSGYAEAASKNAQQQSHQKESATIINGYTETKGGEEEDENKWSKRNARSIDEGIRFKNQLREGLEQQSKVHRARLLSNLLEGVIGGAKGAVEDATDAVKDFDKTKMKNVTNPFRWLSFGRGDRNSTKIKNEGEVEKGGSPKAVRDVYKEITSDTLSANIQRKKSKLSKADKTTTTTTTSRQIGARTITGLIMALAEEVEGLEVEVDADANTPISNKSVPSIKIYFSRLGFRQLRMGGLDEVFSEFETSMKPSERFTLASSFFNANQKPATADEAFDKIDINNSGSLDEVELAQALKMAAIIGGNTKFTGVRSKETLAELASRLVRLYDTNGDGVVDREEYQAMVRDMASLRDARKKEELHERDTEELDEIKRRGWFRPSVFGGKEGDGDGAVSAISENSTATAIADGSKVVDVTDNEEFWGSMDHGEGSIVFEDLKLDLRRLVFGAIPGVKRVLPGGPLVLKPFTATITASLNKDDIMDSWLLDIGLRRLVARALSRRVRGIRDLLDGAVFYGRTWKLTEQNSPQVEVAKLEDVHFDRRNRLIITGRAKIQDALGYKHEPIEQGFKVRTKIGTRANGRIIGLLQPEIAIFAECPKDLETTFRSKCKEWFGYTVPEFKPVYAYIPLVSPLKKDDKMDGFNMGEDNQIRSIDIKNGKLRIEFSAFLRPGRFLGNHYLAFTTPNKTLILTLDRVREGMRNARRNKKLAELAAKEVQELAAAQGESTNASDDDLTTQSGKPSISPEGKIRIKRLEKELKATIQEEAILREIEDSEKEQGKSFIRRFVEGYSGVIREELDLEMNARLSSSISDFFGSQGGSDGEDDEDADERSAK